MPKDLAGLLLDEGAVSPDALGRALDRQRELGGALDTALLEEGALDEEALVAWLSRAAELPPAPASAWDAADARARRVFPSRVAERHGLAPFALDDRELALVATYPVDLGLLDEISFMLSLHLTAHVAPEWRVRELIHRLYGSALPPRLAALAQAAGAPVEAPAPAGDAEPSGPGARHGEEPPRPPAPAAPGGFARDASEPLEPLAAALQEALESFDPSLFEEEPAGAAEDPPEEAGEPAAPPDRSFPPHWKLEDARAALAAAADRDAVVLAAIRYARDFFEYAAVFAVTRDAVAGHDALGQEDERDRARAVAIWATDPGIFKTVIETRSPFLGPVSREAAGNEVILSGLGRDKPRTALVYPVLLRDRPVCVVYADNGEAPVSPRRLGDLLLFLSSLGAAFERIIRDRKKRRRLRAQAPARAAPAPPPADAPAPPPAPAPESLPTEPFAEPFAGFGAPDAAPPPRGEGESAPRAPADGPVPPPDAFAGPDASLEEAEPPGAGDETLSGLAVDVAAEAPEPPPPAPEPAPPAAAPPASADSFDALEAQFFGEGGAPDVDESGPAGRTAPGPTAAAAPAPEPSHGESVPPAAATDGSRTARFAPPPDEPPPVAPPSAPAVPSPPQHAPAAPAASPPEPASLTALADRALDSDAALARAACDALAERRREPGIRQANEKLRRALLSGISSRATRAARALEAIRDVEAIPLLIQVLETSEPETARASADALAAITLQRLGPDARKWLGWWKENRGRGRAEWLFSGLTSADRETRVAASVELSLAAPPPVAYSADLPTAERERIARAWAVWWARSGHVL